MQNIPENKDMSNGDFTITQLYKKSHQKIQKLDARDMPPKTSSP
jgi:hypothetical protein